MSVEQHKLMGMRHMTIVPENHDPEADAEESSDEDELDEAPFADD